MKIGIIGCGLNSAYHINFAKQYGGARIVGLVDVNQERAREVAADWGIKRVFSKIADLVNHAKPDVVHIVTPPHTHFRLAQEVFDLDCNLLIEKPVALNYEEAEKLFEAARVKGVKVCAMHNHFFDPCMLKARQFVDEGKVGRIINVESYYGINTRIDAFRKYPAPNVLPWLYSLPGGVYQDFIAHPLYVMLPFIGDVEKIQVQEYSFGELPQQMSDELRILIRGKNAPGVMTFSFAAKPHQHFVKIYGTKMVVHINFDTMTTTYHATSGLPKAVQKVTYNLGESLQLFSATTSNVFNFLTKKLKPYQGMKTLIHRYYDAIKEGYNAPVSPEEALSVVKTADGILKQVKNRTLSFGPIIPAAASAGETGKSKVLVTGATGFLGTRLVEQLKSRGYPVRALARKLSDTEKLKRLKAEIFFGDVADIDSMRPAFEGVDFVVHAAADTGGDEKESRLSTLLGTSNIIELGKEFNVKKLVYISSCSVYGVSDYKSGQVVTEASSLERHPEKRGVYSEAKLKADNLITSEMKKGGLPIACLRPGTIFGPGGDIYTPMMGFSIGNKIFAIIGNGKFVLPLVYIDNLVDAIVTVMEKKESAGQIYNLIDPDMVNKRQYADLVLRQLYPKCRCLYIPYWFLYTAVFSQEILTKMLRRRPFLTRYRLTSSQRPILYDSARIQRELGWKPPLTVTESIDQLIAHEQRKESV